MEGCSAIGNRAGRKGWAARGVSPRPEPRWRAPHRTTTATASATPSHAVAYRKHLVPIEDAGEADRHPYLAVAFVRGQTLEDRLDEEGPYRSTIWCGWWPYRVRGW